MEFWPECGGMMLPVDGKITCKRCGFKKDSSGEETYKEKEKVKTEENIIMKGDDINTLPTIDIECPKCGHNKAGYWLQQTRSADEAETRFYQCLECKHTWREYD